MGVFQGFENKNQRVYAPVLICTYTRCSHLKKTIESLAKNSCALSTDLYIASDYPYDESHRVLVDEVRIYIKSIDGFKSVNVILRDRNFGANANYYDALDSIFEKHDRVVIMEDDIVTGRYFLQFINDGLNLYGPNGRVLAVAGYIWPKLRINLDSDTLLLPLYSGWGTGYHRENFRKIESGCNVSRRILDDWRLFLKANFLIPGIASPLLDMAEGRLHAWDVDCFLYMLERDLLVLFPKNSLVKNIGFDGTGLHCDIDPSYERQVINEDRPINVREIPPDEFFLCRNLGFVAFGGWRIFLKGLFLYSVKKCLGYSLFFKLVFAKQRILSIFKLR